jgi:hypothetical protein
MLDFKVGIFYIQTKNSYERGQTIQDTVGDIVGSMVDPCWVSPCDLTGSQECYCWFIQPLMLSNGLRLSKKRYVETYLFLCPHNFLNILFVAEYSSVIFGK